MKGRSWRGGWWWRSSGGFSGRSFSRGAEGAERSQPVFGPAARDQSLDLFAHADERGPAADGPAVVLVARKLGRGVEGDAAAADAGVAVALGGDVGDPVEERLVQVAEIGVGADEDGPRGER